MAPQSKPIEPPCERRNEDVVAVEIKHLTEAVATLTAKVERLESTVWGVRLDLDSRTSKLMGAAAVVSLAVSALLAWVVDVFKRGTHP